MNTAPEPVDTVSSPANRSPVLAARVRAASSCSSPRTLMPSIGRSLSLGQVVDVFCTQNDTNGGSNETGTNVLAANPTRTPETSAAIATTPDGKWPKASRSVEAVSLFDAFTGLHSPLVADDKFARVTLPAEYPCASATSGWARSLLFQALRP